MPAETPLPALRPRGVDAHKASVGRVLVVGGSVGMAGAPALCARGALRAGAGLVTVGVPAAILPTVAGFQPEAMTLPLPSGADGALTSAALEPILSASERVDALAIGPGLGRGASTRELVLALVRRSTLPMVIDADALFALGTDLRALAERAAPTVLTPHEGEAARLLGTGIEGRSAPREAWVRRIALDAHAICVLKGPGTLVSDGARVHRNATGGPALATAGAGDVLTGIVAAFLAGLPATGGDAFGAASLAVHVHGLAGDRCATARGDRGSLAGEIADAVPEAVRDVVARTR